MNKLGRKLITCIKCNKYKLHFGLDMCSACLRHTKRQSKPEFYLGTQYSEIKRRCTHKDLNPTRSYFGKQYCSKEEFINKFLNNPIFLDQYKKWQDSGFKRGDSPSVDRIDNNGNYTIDNLQILAHKDNGPKDWSNKVVLYLSDKKLYFESQKELAEYLDYSVSFISQILNNVKKNSTNYEFERSINYENT